MLFLELSSVVSGDAKTFTGPGVHLTLEAQAQRGWCENSLHCNSQFWVAHSCLLWDSELEAELRDSLKGAVLLEMWAGIISVWVLEVRVRKLIEVDPSQLFFHRSWKQAGLLICYLLTRWCLIIRQFSKLVKGLTNSKLYFNSCSTLFSR